MPRMLSLRPVLLVLVVAARLLGADGDIERITTTDGRALTGVYDSEKGQLSIRSGTAVMIMPLAVDKIAKREVVEAAVRPEDLMKAERERKLAEEAEKRKVERERVEAQRRELEDKRRAEREADEARSKQRMAVLDRVRIWATKGVTIEPGSHTADEVDRLGEAELERREAAKVAAERVEQEKRDREAAAAKAKADAEADESQRRASALQAKLDQEEAARVAASRAERERVQKASRVVTTVGLGAIAIAIWVGIILVVGGIAAAPWIIARRRKHHNVTVIFIMTLLSFIGFCIGMSQVEALRTTGSANDGERMIAIIKMATAIPLASISWVAALIWAVYRRPGEPSVLDPAPADAQGVKQLQRRPRRIPPPVKNQQSDAAAPAPSETKP